MLENPRYFATHAVLSLLPLGEHTLMPPLLNVALRTKETTRQDDLRKLLKASAEMIERGKARKRDARRHETSARAPKPKTR